MNCINLRIRSKKYKKYFFCKIRAQKIDYEECKNCTYKTYKKVTKIKGTKHTRTKATDIPTTVKRAVWERDNHKCIFCNKSVSMFYANAHFIPRSAGGLGIEENIFTACEYCHNEQDNGLNTEEYDTRAEEYLKEKYKGCWTKENLIYRKRRNLIYGT